jgi:hypothetical protein
MHSIELFSSLIVNNYFPDGICQWVTCPSEFTVTKTFDCDCVWGLHLKDVIGKPWGSWISIWLSGLVKLRICLVPLLQPTTMY